MRQSFVESRYRFRREFSEFAAKVLKPVNGKDTRSPAIRDDAQPFAGEPMHIIQRFRCIEKLHQTVHAH